MTIAGAVVCTYWAGEREYDGVQGCLKLKKC